MSKRRQVALAVRSGVPYLQDLIGAILLYGRRQGDWQITAGLEYWPALSVKHLRGWKGDGIIAWTNTPAEAQRLAEMGIPAVNVSAGLRHSPVPRVALDDYAVGRLAAEHLLECGFRRVAHYGTTGRWWSQQREAGFTDAVRAAGGSCAVLLARPEVTNYQAVAAHEDELCRWLQSLQTPVGVFATHDYRARKLMEMCHRMELRVPDDVAIVGVNDDPTVCEHTDPPLSSIARNGSGVGRTAAELLDRLMSGDRPQATEILIPPEGVVRRGSTDLRPIDDPTVANAVSFIRKHLHEPIDVSDVVRFLDVSRRTLERLFLKELGTPPHAWLCRMRVRRAKQLLRQREKTTMDDVARACGLSDGRTLRKIFLRQTGMSPRRFRYDPSA